MDDFIQNPYEGANSDEEREVIYQNLLVQYEKADYERRKNIYSNLMVDWEREREYKEGIDQRRHKLVSTIAAGSFGVSFAFISQLVDLNTATNKVFLILSWVFFAITIVLAILELKIGSVIQDKLLDIIEKNMERGYKGEPYLEPNRRLIMWPGRILSWTSVFTFISGLICTVYFVLQNI